MPRQLSDYDLNQIQYVSLADYMRRVDQLEDFEDKLAFTTRYLLSHGMKQGRDHSFEEAVHAAKMKLADASAAIRRNRIMVDDAAVNPDVSPELDKDNRLFMADPMVYLRRQANDILIKAGNGPRSEQEQRRYEENEQMLAALALDLPDNTIAGKISRLDVLPTARDVDLRLEKRYGSKREFEKAYNATKPGILSKMFDTSSKAYHNLDTVYNAFHDPHHVLYGDMNALDKAAVEYLQHCFPRWNPKEGMLDASYVNRLSGTRKARALFSINLIKATAEQRRVETCYDAIITSNLQAISDAQAGVADEENVFREQEDNAEFQQQVQQQIGQEDAPEYDPEQAERDYHANFELDPEEEADDPNPQP